MSKNFLNILKNKWFIQAIVAGVIIYICIDPRVYLHPIAACLLILFFYVVHSYVENLFLMKKLDKKRQKQDKIISTMCDSSENLIAYKDLQGKYIYCNKAMLNTFKTTMDDIKGKDVNNILSSDKSKKIEKLTKMALAGKIKKEILEINNYYYDMTITPLVMGDFIIGSLTIGKNITSEIHLKHELSKSEKQLNLILNCMPTAVFLKDLNGHVTFENKQSFCIFGLTDANYPAKWHNTPTLEETILEEDTTIIKNRCCTSKDALITLKNGKKKWFNIYKYPMVDVDENIIGVCGVVRNIDTEKIAQEERETYVATLTHDLKTPTLAQIKAIDLLLMGENNFSSEQKELLKLTQESCKYMLDMISTILYSYKYDSNDYVLDTDNYDLKVIAKESCDEILSLLEENNNHIIVYTKADECIAKCDKMQIKRVITNLLGNAISYAHKNSTIRLIMKNTKDAIDVKIISKSPYIKPEVLEGLFNKYVSHAAKYNKVGAGLGLYLSKQIVQAHGGEIYARSFETDTNLFGFRLPKVPIPQANKAQII